MIGTIFIQFTSRLTIDGIWIKVTNFIQHSTNEPLSTILTVLVKWFAIYSYFMNQIQWCTKIVSSYWQGLHGSRGNEKREFGGVWICLREFYRRKRIHDNWTFYAEINGLEFQSRSNQLIFNVNKHKYSWKKYIPRSVAIASRFSLQLTTLYNVKGLKLIKT